MQCACRQKIPGPLRPFNQHDALTRLIPSQFVQRIRPIQTPQIIMMNRSFERLVRLDEREAGAGNFHLRVLSQMAQEGSGKRTFPGSQTAGERKTVSGRTTVGNQGRQSFGRKLVIKAYLHDANVDPTHLCQQGRSGADQRLPFWRSSIQHAMTGPS